MHSSHHAWIRLSYTSVVPSLLGKVCVQRVSTCQFHLVSSDISNLLVGRSKTFCIRPLLWGPRSSLTADRSWLSKSASRNTRLSWLVCRSLSLSLSIYLSIHPSIYPSIHPSIHLSIYPSIYLSNYPSSYLYTSLKDQSQVSLSLSLLRKDAPDQQVSRASVNESLDATSSATIPLALLLHNKKRPNILNCVTMWAMLVKSLSLTVLGSTFKPREPRFAQ